MDDDLTEKISQLLGSPEGMQKIQSTLTALGLGGEEGETPPSSGPAVAPGVGEAIPALAAAGEAGGPADPLGGLSGLLGGGGPDLQTLAKLAPMLSGMKKEDENTRLLHSLRPFLSGDREKRLDEAIKILRMTKLLPLLREQNLF